MRIPYDQLSAEALRGIIEEFVLREGTDYGEQQYSLEEKIAHVRAQLESGEAKIVFDPDRESLNVVRAREPEQ